MSGGTVMMSVEGVLMESEDWSLTSQPSTTGRGLYEALSTLYRVVLVTSSPHRAATDHWLRSNLLAGYDQLMVPDNPASERVEVRATQLRALRASRTAMALVVDCDPLVVVHAMSVGIPALLYGPPRPAAGRLDLARRKVRDWSSIEAELDLQRGLRDEEENSA